MEPQRSAGARALREHIDKHFRGSISRFAKAKRLDRVQIARVVNGTRGQRMTVSFATIIEAATDGAVPVSVWAEDTAESSPAAAGDPARVA